MTKSDFHGQLNKSVSESQVSKSAATQASGCSSEDSYEHFEVQIESKLKDLEAEFASIELQAQKLHK